MKPKKVVVEERKPIPKFNPDRQKNTDNDNTQIKTNGEQMKTITNTKIDPTTEKKVVSDEKPSKTDDQTTKTNSVPSDEKPAVILKNEKTGTGKSVVNASSQLLKDQLNALTR